MGRRRGTARRVGAILYAAVALFVLVVGAYSYAPTGDPGASAIVLGVAVLALTWLGLFLFAQPPDRRLRSTLGGPLLIGGALTAASIGYVAAYLDEREGPDRFDAPPQILVLGSVDAPAPPLTNHGAEDELPGGVVTSVVEFTSCDDPVSVTVALWPPSGLRIGGAFGARLVLEQTEDRRLRDPGRVLTAGLDERASLAAIGASGEELALPAKEIVRVPLSRSERELGAGTVKNGTIDPDRPLVTTFDADWAIPRNTSSCFLRMPFSYGQLQFRDKLATMPTGRTVLDTPIERRVVAEASGSPARTTSGSAAWTCQPTRVGLKGSCFVTAVVEDFNANSKLNATLLIVGSLLGLGASLIAQGLMARPSSSPEA